MNALTIFAFIFALQAVTSGRNLKYLKRPNPIDELNQNNYWYIPSTSEKITTRKVTTELPCHKSSYIKEDIEAIVNYMYDQLNLNETIKMAYDKYAKDARDSKMIRLAAFEDWFGSQPKQLKHIIKDISENHKHIEQRVNKLSKLLEEKESVDDKINNQNKKYEALLKKYNLYDGICEDNCAHKISKRNANEDQYCGTAEEIKDRSTSEMLKYVEKLKPELLTTVKNLSQQYDKDIQDMENKIKDISLKDYGPLMYDTLLLQEDYYSYKQIVSENSENTIYEIKRLFPIIEAKLISLELEVDKYKKYCLSCVDNSNPMIYLMNSIVSDTTTYPPSELESLLDIVIKSKTNRIHSQAMNDISYLFHDVDQKMQVIQQRDTDVKNFKPIQEDIKNELNKEKESLKDLKNIVSKENINAFLSLDEPVKLLKSKISDLLKELQQKNI